MKKLKIVIGIIILIHISPILCMSLKVVCDHFSLLQLYILGMVCNLVAVFIFFFPKIIAWLFEDL